MAITNHERVGKAMDLLKTGLGPFIERELKALTDSEARTLILRFSADDKMISGKSPSNWDVAAMLKFVWDSWNEVFRKTFGFSERSIVSELRDVRNRWAHQEAFSSDDTYRALDSSARLLTSVSATQAEEIEKMKQELLRLRFDEQVRSEKRKGAAAVIESTASVSLKPWREVITPHKDVASGRYQQAEFAADLWQVHLGEGTDEYRKPVEFFRRTYLTESLKHLLVGAVRRLAGEGGDPVVQLQTNFGGGKTHSMLALYHLFSGTSHSDLTGIDEVMKDAGAKSLPKPKRVVLVGNKISPGNPVTKPDGTVIRTLWGELAWQLGGKKAFARVAADDERATSPGDALRELFQEYSPCLVLMDEWVAYARQLHDQSDLPAGSFETQFSFAQVLTESAKLAKNCLLVISLPASDTTGSPHIQAEDEEVGGERGRAALSRLRNVIARVESSWTPATAEEGFEIVRRRLFEPLSDPALFRDRDVVARTFADFYRANTQEFPPECRDADYEKRIKAAYPIHPEVFDRLYTDWSTLVKFQRTRGVLRLMAAVIHYLWDRGDKNPLILPANIPMDSLSVRDELTRYLPDTWKPVIEKDVDGPNSLPFRIDGELAGTLGKFSACRRVARTIYLGSAPTTGAAHRGIEDRRVKLGCAMPGESPSVFGDALRRLAAAATYLYQDGPRYWYSTQPTVTKLADDRAEQLKRDPDKIVQDLDKRLRNDLRKVGDFSRIHPMPHSGQDVSDDLDARLVVLGIDHPYSKEPGNAAEKAAKVILEWRGNASRIYRNTLAFLAPDRTRLQDLDEAVRRFLAWESIIGDREQLDLSPHQMKQAQTQRDTADTMVNLRIPETYQWLLVPTQSSPQLQIEWQAMKVSGSESLAVRASTKLRKDELLVTALAGTRLRMDLDKIPLWRGDHVSIRQLSDDFARYTYLPRLKGPEVLIGAVREGLSLLSWDRETFAYADSFDEGTGKYRGLRAGQHISINDAGLLVRPDVAQRQFQADAAATTSTTEPPSSTAGTGETGASPTTAKPGPAVKQSPKRFHGTVALDPARVGRDAARIADEVIAHLTGLLGSNVSVTLDIDAEIPAGAPENVVRTVTENSRTLKFKTGSGFEQE